ncbi:ImmA/IrrE family metallo-endopeptidase [Streptomyces sp. NPDC056296]|uniref:ImmA/IrrE family metallo-endopeptidase n=1 Tax=Streptomyces sp. NPDC056296 TaxID=3345775 RepID=UPI0035DA1349
MHDLLGDPVLHLAAEDCQTLVDPASPREVSAAVRAAAREATGTLLVYYAGHGLIAAAAPATAAEAEEMAATARRMLGLGPAGPAHNIAGLAAALGLLIFSLDRGHGADGGTVLLGRGGVTLINGSRMVGRRRLAAAHELGHFLIADEYAMNWRIASADADGQEARLDRFARALLLPESDLRARWARWTHAPDEG